ncbi:tRNA pseudouridine(55) synthase TruB [Pasteuria penetrans]|uniref:tRNA pseudouridine(55) synthase TruB n=1 Tax=Pasteuria penetrans TaxID=86005 RepID=UPI000FAE3EC6|nr:tRNA pseudouridine(55) synthase TruB [Pasteuria penetrans]
MRRGRSSGYHGVLLLSKPRGCTSHDMVARVRRLLGETRIGHTGTLDPDAEGLLVLCVGQATRLVTYLQMGEKEYESVFRFGVGTDTDDAVGKIVDWHVCPYVNSAAVEDVLSHFQGEIEQQVPHYSAVRVGGKRLHMLARQGDKSTTPPTRKVHIFSLTLQRFHTGLFPEARMGITCGPGTYIRSLARDMGGKLGVPAHVSFLRRTRSGWFSLADAHTLHTLERVSAEGNWAEIIFPLGQVLTFFPSVKIASEDKARLLAGWPLVWEGDLLATPVRVYTEDGDFCALYRAGADGFALPEKVFASC